VRQNGLHQSVCLPFIRLGCLSALHTSHYSVSLSWFISRATRGNAFPIVSVKERHNALDCRILHMQFQSFSCVISPDSRKRPRCLDPDNNFAWFASVPVYRIIINIISFSLSYFWRTFHHFSSNVMRCSGLPWSNSRQTGCRFSAFRVSNNVQFISRIGVTKVGVFSETRCVVQTVESHFSCFFTVSKEIAVIESVTTNETAHGWRQPALHW